MYSCNLLWSKLLVNQGCQKKPTAYKNNYWHLHSIYGQLLLLVYYALALFALQKLWLFCKKLCQQETISRVHNFSLLPKFFSSVTKLQRCGWVDLEACKTLSGNKILCSFTATLHQVILVCGHDCWLQNFTFCIHQTLIFCHSADRALSSDSLKR